MCTHEISLVAAGAVLLLKAVKFCREVCKNGDKLNCKKTLFHLDSSPLLCEVNVNLQERKVQ